MKKIDSFWTKFWEKYEDNILLIITLLVFIGMGAYISYKVYQSYIEDNRLKEYRFDYIEKYGGLAIGKKSDGQTTVVKVKDSVFFFTDEKLFYLSEKGDSVYFQNKVWTVKPKN